MSVCEYDSALLFRDDGKTGMIMYNGSGQALAHEDTPFTYTISDDSDITISFAGKTLHAKVMLAMELKDGIRIRFDPYDPENDCSDWIMEKLSGDPDQLRKTLFCHLLPSRHLLDSGGLSRRGSARHR